MKLFSKLGLNRHRSYFFNTRVLNFTLLLTLLLSGTAFSAVNDLTSWSLRFPTKQSINQATTGCYGTASYGYRLPTIEYVLAYREGLKSFAQDNTMDGFAFTSEKDSKGDFLVVDLGSGRIGSVPRVFNASYKGVVFCQCRSDLTQSAYIDGSPNCAHSNVIRPLGQTFLATRDDISTDPNTPQPSEDWTDPVTGWQWHFADVAVNWESAMASCTGDYHLPDHATIAHALKRLWNSRLGIRLRAADARRLWTNEEFDLWSAMAVFLPSGNAGSAGKRSLFPVICVKQ